VVTRFGKKSSAKTVPCSIIPTVQQPQESKAREGPAAKNQHAGAHFSPGEPLAEDKPHPKITSNSNGQEPSQKARHVLLGNWRQQILFLAIVYNIFIIADLLDHPAAVQFTILVIVLAPDSNGIKSIIDRLMRSDNISKVPILLLLFSSFGIRGASAQDDGEDG
jgi:hypothetical protein